MLLSLDYQSLRLPKKASFTMALIQKEAKPKPHWATTPRQPPARAQTAIKACAWKPCNGDGVNSRNDSNTHQSTPKSTAACGLTRAGSAYGCWHGLILMGAVLEGSRFMSELVHSLSRGLQLKLSLSSVADKTFV